MKTRIDTLIDLTKTYPERTLQVEIRQNYGNEAVYPMNEVAEVFAVIAGTTTLKPDTLRLAKVLGYEIEIVVPTPKATW